MPLIRKPGPKAAPPVEQRRGVDVLEALRGGSKEERWAAARAIANIPEHANALAAAVRVELDRGVREAMFTSLARMGSPESLDALCEFVRSDDASVRAGALDALRTNVAAMRTRLPQLLSDADSDVRLLCCELARSLPSDEATRMLAAVLVREADVNVCAAAIDVLTEAGRAEALPALEACEARFKDSPFLAFAIAIAKERIHAQSTPRHG